MEDYDRRYDAFLLDMVISFVFDGDSPPEEPVIKYLMNRVTDWKDETQNMTSMNTFLNDVKENTSVKSALMQQLLKSK